MQLALLAKTVISYAISWCLFKFIGTDYQYILSPTQQYILVYFHVRRFVGKAIQIELCCKLYSIVTGPGSVALFIELGNEFDRPPNPIERNNQSPSRSVAPQI